jgi:hypothetical protein
MRRLLRPLLILLALVFLLEAWLWEHLAPVVAWIVARIPLRELKTRIATAIESLPPSATLVVFIIPVLLLLPLKFLGLWMLAHGYWLGALAVLAPASPPSSSMSPGQSCCSLPGSPGSTTASWSGLPGRMR